MPNNIDDNTQDCSDQPKTGVGHACDEYTVQINAFHGPLDLLLYLIRRAEVDIIDIPIAEITNQYIDYLKGMQHIDMEQAGEFLVMAATLLEIKSRMITPPEIGEDGEPVESESIVGDDGLNEADPRYELVCQLMAYKKFRDAAQHLDERRTDWSARRPTAAVALADDDDDSEDSMIETDIEDIGVWDLFSVFQRIIEAVDFTQLGDHHVEYDDTPLALHQDDILDQLGRSEGGKLSLRQIVVGRTQGEMMGLFLALLELVRIHDVVVSQDRLHDDILITRRVEPDSGAPNEIKSGQGD